jgi:hypothetical protein
VVLEVDDNCEAESQGEFIVHQLPQRPKGSRSTFLVLLSDLILDEDMQQLRRNDDDCYVESSVLVKIHSEIGNWLMKNLKCVR